MNILDTSAIKAFGQIAGIGGLSLLVFAWLFREVIRKRIFPQLSREHAYEIIRLFMLLVFALSLSGIGAWVYVEKIRPPSPPAPIVPAEDAGAAVTRWLALIDAGSYHEAWQTMPQPFQKRLAEDAFVALATAQRKPKGAVLSRTPYGSNTISSPPGYPPGEYEGRSFMTQFQDGSRVIEAVLAMGTEGGWRVASHTLSPPLP